MNLLDIRHILQAVADRKRRIAQDHLPLIDIQNYNDFFKFCFHTHKFMLLY